MAYRIDPRTCVLVFEDGVLEGSEIRCTLDVPLRVLLDIQAAADSGDVLSAMTIFASRALKSWTLEDECGDAIAATADGMMSLPVTICTAILTAWVGAVAAAPLASGRPSPDIVT